MQEFIGVSATKLSFRASSPSFNPAGGWPSEELVILYCVYGVCHCVCMCACLLVYSIAGLSELEMQNGIKCWLRGVCNVEGFDEPLNMYSRLNTAGEIYYHLFIS